MRRWLAISVLCIPASSAAQSYDGITAPPRKEPTDILAEMAKSAAKEAEKAQVREERIKREGLGAVLADEKCRPLIQKDDYVNYEACVRYWRGR